MGQTNDAGSETDRHVKDLLTKAKKNIHTDSNKAFKYLNEALKYKNSINTKQLLSLYEILAALYSNQQSYFLALDYYYKSLELQKKNDSSRLHFIYNNIGCTYMQLGDPVKAYKFLNKSLVGLRQAIAKGSIGEKNVEAYLVYSNLAAMEMENKNYPKALEMLHIYKKQVIRLKDTVGVIITYQNLSNVYDGLKNADSSKFYLDKGIYMAKKSRSSTELSFLYYYRGLNYSKVKNDSAVYYLQTAFDLATKTHLNDAKLSSAKALADLYDSKKDYKNANYYMRIASKLSEKDISQQSKKKIELLEFENAQEKRQQDALTKTQKRENILIFSFILLLPVSMIIFLMYRLQRTKAKQRKVENELLVQKMESKNKELKSKTIQMLQASEIIDSTHKELNQLKGISDTPTNKMLTQIISDLKQGNQSFNKKEFEKLFIETDEDFYRKLLREYPTLTKNEVRLCAFAKMNFSTKEISAITQQSNNSILVARSRLRKKIGLAENQSLTNFFKSL